MQAAAKTNDTAGDGTTTATILSAAIIAEGMKIVAAGANPVQVSSGFGLRTDGHPIAMPRVPGAPLRICHLFKASAPLEVRNVSQNACADIMAMMFSLQLTRGIEKTVAKLVERLAESSTEVTDEGLADVAAVSAGNNRLVSTACSLVLLHDAPDVGL